VLGLCNYDQYVAISKLQKTPIPKKIIDLVRIIEQQEAFGIFDFFAATGQQ